MLVCILVLAIAGYLTLTLLCILGFLHQFSMLLVRRMLSLSFYFSTAFSWILY